MHRSLDPAGQVAEGIGERVLHERERLGLAQAELALTAGVSTRVVHQIEHGKATSRLDSLVAVLDVLGLTLQARRGSHSIGLR